MVKTNKKIDQFSKVDEAKKQILEQGKEPTSPPQWMYFNALYAPFMVTIIVVVYLLVTDMSDWVFNLGQYNVFILEYLPHAQTWVNSSGQYREKMILIYLFYSIITVYVVLCYSFFWIKYWTIIMVYGEYSRKKNHSLVYPILAAFLLMLLGGYCVTILYLGGSDVFLTDEQLNALDSKSKYSFYAKWNSSFSFVMAALTSLAGWLFLIMGAFSGTYNLIKAYRKLREKIVNFKL